MNRVFLWNLLIKVPRHHAVGLLNNPQLDFPHKSHLEPHHLREIHFPAPFFFHVSYWPLDSIWVHLIQKLLNLIFNSPPSCSQQLSPTAHSHLLQSLADPSWIICPSLTSSKANHATSLKITVMAKKVTKEKVYPCLVVDCMGKEDTWSREPTYIEMGASYEWPTKFSQAAHNTGIASSLL